MQVVKGGDWSVGLNTGNALDDAQLLLRFGESLRKVYADVLQEPLPEDWAAALKQLEEAQTTKAGS